MEQKKARRFVDIFRSLDADGTGLISARNIDISRMN
jgi:hypothetical protein